MKYWRSGILCALIVCLGCGTLTHTRTARPSFVSPPAGRPFAPSVPDQAPDNSTIQPSLPSRNGPLLNPSTSNPSTSNPSTRKTHSTRISTFQQEAEKSGFTPPPKKGYIELPPPAEAGGSR